MISSAAPVISVAVPERRESSSTDITTVVAATAANTTDYGAECFRSASDSVALILPCLIELCKDEDAGVREAILNTVGACMPYFDRGMSIVFAETVFSSLSHS